MLQSRCPRLALSLRLSTDLTNGIQSYLLKHMGRAFQGFSDFTLKTNEHSNNHVVILSSLPDLVSERTMPSIIRARVQRLWLCYMQDKRSLWWNQLLFCECHIKEVTNIVYKFFERICFSTREHACVKFLLMIKGSSEKSQNEVLGSNTQILSLPQPKYVILIKL